MLKLFRWVDSAKNLHSCRHLSKNDLKNSVITSWHTHTQKANGMISYQLPLPHTQTHTRSFPPTPVSLYVNMLRMCCISVFSVKERCNPSMNSPSCWGTQKGHYRLTHWTQMPLFFFCMFFFRYKPRSKLTICANRSCVKVVIWEVNIKWR